MHHPKRLPSQTSEAKSDLRPRLAVRGGPPLVTIPSPHFTWPFPASEAEKKALVEQRDLDISIKGRTGPILALEEAFLHFLDHQVRYAISFNSGTSALLAAYFAVGIEAGDEVIVPAITYHAAVTPLFILRAQPVLVDVDPRTWTLNPALIEAAITPHTKAITVVHQWGHPAEMQEVMRLAKKYRLKVIEDCSHAHGSRYRGQLVGTFGEVAVFSLQANKLVFAGEGGMLVTNTPEYHDRATLLGHYRDRARDEITDPDYQQFWVTGYGLKLRMSPFNAITALYSLQAAPERIRQRFRCLTYLSQALTGLPELTVPFTSRHVDRGAWYGYKPLYFPEELGGLSRHAYIEALQAEGVAVSEPGSPAFSQVPLFTVRDDHMFSDRRGKRIYKIGDFPVAEYLAANALSLPTFTRWPEDQPIIDQYVAAFWKIHDQYQELL